MLKLNKEYTYSIDRSWGLVPRLSNAIVHGFTTIKDIWKINSGRMSVDDLQPGTFRYRTATITVHDPNEEVDHVKSVVKGIIRDYKLTGVKATVTKDKKITITLKNTLVGDRIHYYSLEVKDANVKIVTKTADLEKGEKLKYGTNMYKTKSEAEAVMNKVMDILSGK